MFEKIVTAIEPFGLTMVVIAGLVLANRLQVSDRVIVGYITTFVGASLIVVHVARQVLNQTSNSKKKDK